MGLLAEQFRDLGDNRRHTRGATDQDHLVNFGRFHAGVFQSGLRRADSPLHQCADKLIEFRPGQCHRQVLGACRIRCDEWQIELRLRNRRKFNLRPLSLNSQALERGRITPEIDTVVGLELVCCPVDYRKVKIIATQVRVSICRLHLENAVADL